MHHMMTTFFSNWAFSASSSAVGRRLSADATSLSSSCRALGSKSEGHGEKTISGRHLALLILQGYRRHKETFVESVTGQKIGQLKTGQHTGQQVSISGAKLST